MSEKETIHNYYCVGGIVDLSDITSVIALSYLTHDLDMFYLYLTAKLCYDPVRFES